MLFGHGFISCCVSFSVPSLCRNRQTHHTEKSLGPYEHKTVLFEWKALIVYEGTLWYSTFSSPAEEKKPSSVERLLKIATMLVHQAPLFVGHVLNKGGAGRDQFEEVMLFRIAQKFYCDGARVRGEGGHA